MCIMPSPKVPSIPEREPIPTPVSEDVIRSMEERRAKARRGAGHAGTILTSGLLEETEPRRRRTLLGV